MKKQKAVSSQQQSAENAGLFDVIGDLWKSLFPSRRKPTPADFRRGNRKVRGIGISIDMNSKHIGNFKGGITPMKRRFKGVSRTANEGKA